ncbi:hypothetical protein Dimus_039629 [Dionaea muscipula]
MSYRFSCRVLVSTFVERWFPETNTFHFLFGEMTITPEDVHQLLGLSVMGRPVLFERMTDRATVTELMVDLLGASAADLAVAMDGSLVRLKWLRSHFQPLGTDDASDEEVEHAVRAYLLYLLGTTIFTSKSGDKVSGSYLHLLRDLTCLNGFAWGATCLAFLYRELGKVSRVGTRQVVGYLTLLEAWVLEHFTMFRGTYDWTCPATLPLAFRWIPRRDLTLDTTHLRDILNHYSITEVVFDPYVRPQDQIHMMTYYRGSLCFLSHVEPYYPGRVVRQFRLVQPIPSHPIRPTRASLGRSAASYTVVYPWVEH